MQNAVICFVKNMTMSGFTLTQKVSAISPLSAKVSLHIGAVNSRRSLASIVQATRSKGKEHEFLSEGHLRTLQKTFVNTAHAKMCGCGCLHPWFARRHRGAAWSVFDEICPTEQHPPNQTCRFREARSFA
ncbi:hypothetical protein CYMTET_18138 [Cymbomonas tetramitiformis]|uniref:Uncharacterized protein n=1 Tax=Cymbomonas tetramitiformis TaxID=36881 RepID=A0AAE0L6G0_9CHLO|nr:hypothetical protein CYMTET_18138 [Cymbomonas tetramitiformis]